MRLISIFLVFFAVVDAIKSISSNRGISFVIRYVFVFFLFSKCKVFESEVGDFIISEFISIGFCLYIVSYAIVGVLMKITRFYSPSFWSFAYFLIYIGCAVILRIAYYQLVINGILPLNF